MSASQDASAIITLRVPKDLKRKLKDAAEWREMSLNKMITDMLARRVEQLEKAERL